MQMKRYLPHFGALCAALLLVQGFATSVARITSSARQRLAGEENKTPNPGARLTVFPSQTTPGTFSDRQRIAVMNALRAVHDKQRNVGLSAAVVWKGKLVFSEGLGYADLERKIPVTRQTLFPVASATKAFTGAALVKLYEAGRINLDASVQQYVPEFPRKAGGEITPRLLAAHLAGIRAYRNDERAPEFYARHYDNVMNALTLFQADPLIAAPGSRYAYTSYGYNLLAAAIQSAAGKPYDKYVIETILKPLKLKQTVFEDIRRLPANRTENYSFYDPFTFQETQTALKVPRLDYSYNLGGGNILTTAEELARFGQAFIRSGYFTKESLALFYTRLRHNEVESPWSYGWFVAPDPTGTRRIYITGGFAGAQSALQVYPDDELVIAIISNTWGINSRSNEMVLDLPRRVADIVRAPR
jgi:serine beta-lactamase-like protein LACTB, mitochondrial